ncbi:MAG: FtsL-like putative cell division protein [Cytophagales bacterium]|nr:FtsL-like putative cell division protein [Cytophagales bacterium]
MGENKFRLEADRSNEPRVKTSGGGTTLFSGLERRLKLENYFEEGFPVKYLPKILFVMVLGLLYISNTHHAEKTVRKIDHVQTEVEELRADYTTLKSDLMFASKQSEVARKVKNMGLKESANPPTKIEIKKSEY